MASYLQIDGLTKSVGDRMLFADLTFGIDEGDKIAIVAKNGTGKSTLLNIIAGKDSPDSGSVIFRADLNVGYVEQNPGFSPDACVLECCLLTDRSNEMTARQMLTSLGLTDMDAKVNTLSGGQHRKIAIVRALSRNPDLIILDEPTNHLDIEMIEWLEKYLRRQRLTLLMVTHDRYFLDRVCTRIIELDDARAYVYDGNYDYYLRRRAERIEAQNAETDRVRNILRKEQDWMSRQPQARAGKAKFRIDRFYQLKERSRGRGIERRMELEVNSSYIGSKIFEAQNICKRFGDKVILDDFSYVFARYEKLGIVGPNGAGKSTFIKLLQGIIPADSGKWDIGQTVRFGYYSQKGISFDSNKKVIDAVTEIADDIKIEGLHIAPMQFLQKFLFSPADQQKYIHTLSGGERCRLHLATVLMRQPNFLILDEPTNDLDIITLGVLEAYLADFKGCVIVISHDRFFLDNVVDHLFVMEGNGVVKDFPGSYSEYREWKDQQQRIEKVEAKTEPASRRVKAERKEKLSYKERKEFEALETELQALNDEKAQLDALFQSNEPVPDIERRSARYTELLSLIDDKEMRWLELSEKAD